MKKLKKSKSTETGFTVLPDHLSITGLYINSYDSFTQSGTTEGSIYPNGNMTAKLFLLYNYVKEAHDYTDPAEVHSAVCEHLSNINNCMFYTSTDGDHSGIESEGWTIEYSSNNYIHDINNPTGEDLPVTIQPPFDINSEGDTVYGAFIAYVKPPANKNAAYNLRALPINTSTTGSTNSVKIDANIIAVSPDKVTFEPIDSADINNGEKFVQLYALRYEASFAPQAKMKKIVASDERMFKVTDDTQQPNLAMGLLIASTNRQKTAGFYNDTFTTRTHKLQFGFRDIEGPNPDHHLKYLNNLSDDGILAHCVGGGWGWPEEAFNDGEVNDAFNKGIPMVALARKENLNIWSLSDIVQKWEHNNYELEDNCGNRLRFTVNWNDEGWGNWENDPNIIEVSSISVVN